MNTFLTFAGLAGLSLLVGLTLSGAPAEAAFPGQNGRIACDGERNPSAPPGPPPAPGPPNSEFANGSEVYSMNPDGSGVTLLTSNATADTDPNFSPDDTRIAFESRRSTNFPTHHTMNADGTSVDRVLFIVGASFESSWSPDGANIAFMDGSRPSFDVSRVRADGSDYRPLTANTAQDGRPAWSPGGARIAFASSRDGNFEIYTMNAETGDASAGEVQQLTSTAPPIQNTMPNWSPDGAKIAFATSRDGVGVPSNLGDDNLEIYTMNADGSDPERLTFNAADDSATSINEASDERPAWSPDGTKFVFSSRRSGDAEVYTMNAADGSGVTRITNSPGFDLRCDWGPRVAPPPAPPHYPRPASACPPGTSPVVTCQPSGTGLRITGTSGRDRLVGTSGNDTIRCGDGNDVVLAGPGDDLIRCGDGNDVIAAGTGNDDADGVRGNDRVDGDPGNDRVGGGTGNDRLNGSSGRDRISGGAGNDRAAGNSGSDSINGGAASDRLAGNEGNDRISGGSTGNDRLSGNSGNDRLSGGSGRDSLVAGTGADRLAGGSDSDRLNTRDRRPRDTANCGESRRDRDRAAVDRGDRVRGCERVRRRA